MSHVAVARLLLRPARSLSVGLLFVGLLAILSAVAKGKDSTAGKDVPAAERAAQVAYFETHIRPALQRHCLECHADDTEASGGLVLDTAAGWRAGGGLGTAINPGDAASSLLIRAIEYDDYDLQMPPGGKLDEETIGHFRRWIDSGATDPRGGGDESRQRQTGLPVDRAGEHWAYRPLRSVPPPLDSPSSATPIDAFLDRALRKADLSAAGPAARRKLLRRVTFGLTGLPPSPEQLHAFAIDRRPDAWQRRIDALLASPAFGENLARRWMDVARFAESITLRGFVLDNAWRYRDYLVRAYNVDRPFDRMIVDQLAGDLAPPADASPRNRVAQRQMAVTATGFLAMGNTNLEDQDKEHLEFDHIDEQLATIGRAFLGQTIACARCHDHKFDPIPTADYYAMAAVLRSTVAMRHSNVSKWIDHPLPLSDEAEQRYRHTAAEVDRLESQMKTLKKRRDRLSGAADKNVRSKDLSGIVIDDSHATLVGSWTPSTSNQGYIDAGYQHDGNRGQGKKTATFEPKSLPAGRHEVRLAYTPGTNRATRVKVDVFSANESKTIYVNQRQKPDVAGRWTSLGTFPFEANGQGFVIVSNEDADGHVIIDAVQFLSADAPEEGRVPAGPTKEDKAELTALKKQIGEAAEQLGPLKAELADRPQYLTVLEGEPKRQMPIRVRGLTHTHGEKVSRGFLTAIGRPDRHAAHISGNRSGRLQMANWMIDAHNPLTPRVYANRVWSWVFDEGIAPNENNFGTTGPEPSHPELLDFLATRLRDHGWSSKRLIRDLVLTDAYQRSRLPAEERHHRVDPDNRLLWSAPLRRLSAETLRDAMMAHSGELDRHMFGSGIRSGTKADYGYQHDSRRRSLYHPVFRNSLAPLLEAFDFADTSVSVGDRNRSTVPTQSLAIMNSPWVGARVDHAANVWSDRLAAVPIGDKIDTLYLHLLGREPSAAEHAACREFLIGDEGNSSARGPDRLGQLIHALFAGVDFRYLE